MEKLVVWSQVWSAEQLADEFSGSAELQDYLHLPLPGCRHLVCILRISNS